MQDNIAREYKQKQIFQAGVEIPQGGLSVGGNDLTDAIQELAALDGLTASVAELNKLDGVTLTTEQINSLLDILTLANGLQTFLAASLLVNGTLAISATAEEFKTTTDAIYLLAGRQISKSAADGLTFSAADTINTAGDTGDFHGAWLVQVNAAGTISTKPAGGNTDQVYTSKQDAVDALPDADADNIALGYITVQANSDSSWTANTDDLTDGSDCVEATFNDYDADALPSTVS